MSVKRIYVEKKAPYAVEAKQLLWEIRHILQIKTVTGLRLLNRYDVEGVDDALYQKCLPVVFSEPQVDVTYTALPHGAKAVFAVEYLPGQYDQRAASCEECIQLVGQCARPTVRSARVYLLDGDFTADELARVKKHVINPVEAREADLGEKTTLQQQYDTPDHVETLTGFTAMNADEVDAFVKKYGLAMDDDDLAFCRDYFASEHRDPTLTEIRMIDTYWSDHCRHTTFLTTLDAVDVRKAAVEKAFQRYLAARKTVYGDRERPMNLMDIATIGGKYLKKIGQTPNIDVSEEINACSIKIDVDVDGVKEPWLLMFKNETHNHPTEIEPFGGAATCIGGAIRDPLSGRTYVYQAMRVTGAADPLVPVSQTMPGKLPQRKLVTTAAAGYSSYGNEKKFAMMAAYMASKGYVVACISYRLWPEYDWDCALFDAKRALAWLKKNASRYGGDPEKIGVVGGSSGGVMSVQLAATTGTFWSSDFFEGIDDSVQACVAMAAGCDMTNPRRFGKMFGNDHKKAARYSPYTYLNPSMPPVLLLHAKNDPAVTSNESRMMKSALDKLGVKCEAVYYDSNDHAFWNVKPNDPFRLRSWNDAVAFFDKILKKK